MSDPVALPAMNRARSQAWHALMELHASIPGGWALVGGQLVHLHCAERDASPVRPTDDVDTVVNIRADPNLLATFTSTLKRLGYTPDTTGDGLQHRWRNGDAQIDVLIPEGVGERARHRTGAEGAPTISAPGTTQALHRTEPVVVIAAGRVGTVLRPNLVGALVGKAAARTEIAGDSRSASRHCTDFVVLASLVAASDFRNEDLTPKDRKRLRTMIALCRADEAAIVIEAANESLSRLERAAALGA